MLPAPSSAAVQFDSAAGNALVAEAGQGVVAPADGRDDCPPRRIIQLAFDRGASSRERRRELTRQRAEGAQDGSTR